MDACVEIVVIGASVTIVVFIIGVIIVICVIFISNVMVSEICIEICIMSKAMVV